MIGSFNCHSYLGFFLLANESRGKGVSAFPVVEKNCQPIISIAAPPYVHFPNM